MTEPQPEAPTYCHCGSRMSKHMTPCPPVAQAGVSPSGHWNWDVDDAASSKRIEDAPAEQQEGIRAALAEKKAMRDARPSASGSPSCTHQWIDAGICQACGAAGLGEWAKVHGPDPVEKAIRNSTYAAPAIERTSDESNAVVSPEGAFTSLGRSPFTHAPLSQSGSLVETSAAREEAANSGVSAEEPQVRCLACSGRGAEEHGGGQCRTCSGTGKRTPQWVDRGLVISLLWREWENFMLNAQHNEALDHITDLIDELPVRAQPDRGSLSGEGV
jgi:hypothetical protein